MLIASCYRPPTQNDFWDMFGNVLENVKEDATKYLFILGDLNANFNTYQGDKLNRFCITYNLNVHNFECTRITATSSTVLDQLLSNVPAFVRSVHIDPPVSTNDHSTLSAVLNFKVKHDESYKRLVWDYKNANFDEFRTKLCEASWDDCFTTGDINVASKMWNELFLNIARTCIPNKIVTIRPRDSPWFTTKLHQLKRKVNRSYSALKNSVTLHKWNKYKSNKLKYEHELKEAESAYNAKLSTSLQHERHTGRWWCTVKNLLGKVSDSSSYPPLEYNNTFLSDNRDKAELFNSYFISNSNIDTTRAQLPLFNYLTEFRLDTISVTEREVADMIKCLKSKKASGHDGIGPTMLQQAGASIVTPLTQLINLSLTTSTVPTDWKKAQVTPIYKKNNRSDPNNYRPISILPTISKIAEKIVFKHVYNFFFEHSLLTREQSCVPGDSTVNQLLFLYHTFGKAIDENKDIQIIYCDVKKAFEKVWHKGLIFKLKQLGITGPLLSWFDDYLNNRYQRVCIRGQYSSWRIIPAGVPQGSVLGPLLFMVYINDLVMNINCNIKLYADDTTLYVTTNDLNNSSVMLNKDLQSINSWANQWLVTFCPDKTVYMYMSSKKKEHQQHPPLLFNGKVLNQVENHKHLGMTFNRKLSWSPHVNNIAKGAGNCIDAMKKLKYTMDRKTLETIYLTFVRPKLEYASIVFHDCTKQDTELLENLQLAAARVVTGAIKGTSHAKMYNECNWPLLSERRKQNQLVQFFKMVNDESPQYLTSLVPNLVGDLGNYNLRNNHKFKNIATRTVKF